VEDGDRIRIDIPNRRIDLLLDEASWPSAAATPTRVAGSRAHRAHARSPAR
jgi:dihydroxyacid dehydratase/phosphogluconate dehydratase